MKIYAGKYQLNLEYPFGIASYTRNHHDIVLLEIHYKGLVGYGEASMAKYLGETPESVMAFISRVNVEQLNPEKFSIAECCGYLDSIAEGNVAAKAALDIALHDLKGKMEQRPCYTMYGAIPDQMPVTSLTVGIDKPEAIREKVRRASAFKAIKVKLGSKYDKDIIHAVRAETSLPLYIDANQGWQDKYQALDMIHWLAEQGATFVEQPMNKDNKEANGWITQNSPVPIIADEAMQRLEDVEDLAAYYSGVNVKLMKCAGVYEGYQVIQKARGLGLKVMIGCMTETSCAIAAAAVLAPFCDWADLDGPWLITNNPFQDPVLEEGKIQFKNE
ncbi:dipeptide epimerase, partial [Pseudoxanthomonas sp. SGD-10]